MTLPPVGTLWSLVCVVHVCCLRLSYGCELCAKVLSWHEEFTAAFRRFFVCASCVVTVGEINVCLPRFEACDSPVNIAINTYVLMIIASNRECEQACYE